MVIIMNRQQKMANFIVTLEAIARHERKFLTFDTVYYYMTQGLIKNKTDKSYRVNSLFSSWVNYFKSIPNINVFVADNWKYFCQFQNLNNPEMEHKNEIKMYLSIDSKHIDYVAKDLFGFLARENINHISKIGSEIRSDDVVIRVFRKEDSFKIANYIKNNKHIRKGFNELNPFCIQQDGIGYAMDRNLSYNMTVARYLMDYVNLSISNNEKASLLGFYNYLEWIFNNVFIKHLNEDEYLSKFIDYEVSDYEKACILANYYEVTMLILGAIKNNSIGYFYSYEISLNADGEYEKRIDSFKHQEPEIPYSKQAKELFDEYIIRIINRFGYDSACLNIIMYLQTGNLDCIVTDNNLRERFANSMDPQTCRAILNGMTLNNYISNLDFSSIKTY